MCFCGFHLKENPPWSSRPRAQFQAWLNHGRILDCELSTQAARELVRRFGGHPSSADWRHFGRLAGFTNQKPQKRLENGLPPFVHLRESSGSVYDQVDNFIRQIAAVAAAASTKRAARPKSRSFIRHGSIRRLAEFHGDSRYDGDLHRADMAWALYAASHGLSEEEIQSEILHARDLSKKADSDGSSAMQSEPPAKQSLRPWIAHWLACIILWS
jgi:hypothetical protein